MQENIKWPSKHKIKPDEEGNQIAWLILSAVKKLRVGRNKLASFLKGSRSKMVAPISDEQIYGGLCWIDIATIRDLIEQLERMGFIQRKAIENNPFYSILELTEAGKKVLDEKIRIPTQITRRVKPVSVGVSEKTTYELFKHGKTIGEIALERNLAESTIYTHLYRLIVNNYLSSSEVVSKDTLKRISDATARFDSLPSVKEIKEILPDIGYDEIRCTLAGIRKK